MMAYVLGFITADGCLIKNKRGAYFIEIQSSDREIIYKIRKTLNTDLKIGQYCYGNKKRYRLQIGSKEMFNDLVSLGLSPRKTKSVKITKSIPNKCFRHYLRGYFDGDGCVNICTYKRKNRKSPTILLNSGFVSSSKQMLVDLRKKLSKLEIINGGTLYYHDSAYRLWFAKYNSLNLYKFMYNHIGSELYLARKKKVFEKYMGA